MSGVNAANWHHLARWFIADRGGGFVIALEHGEHQGVEFHPTLRQWGAWLSYLEDKKIPLARWLRAIAAGRVRMRCVTVPAEWPHLFDMEATLADDTYHATLFAENYQQPQEPEGISTPDMERRRAHLAAMKARFPAEFGERPQSPAPVTEEPKGKFVDVAELFRCYDKDTRKDGENDQA